jgi:hypothetical protein
VKTTGGTGRTVRTLRAAGHRRARDDWPSHHNDHHAPRATHQSGAMRDATRTNRDHHTELWSSSHAGKPARTRSRRLAACANRLIVRTDVAVAGLESGQLWRR